MHGDLIRSIDNGLWLSCLLVIRKSYLMYRIENQRTVAPFLIAILINIDKILT